MRKLVPLVLALALCVSLCAAAAGEAGDDFDVAAWLAAYEELMGQIEGKDIGEIEQEAAEGEPIVDGELPAWYGKYVRDGSGEIVYDENGLHIVFFGFIEHPDKFEHGLADLLIINETGADIEFNSEKQYINSFEAMNWNGDVDLEDGECVYLKNEFCCMFDLEDLIKHEIASITDYKMVFTVNEPRTEGLKRGEEMFSTSFTVRCDQSIFDIWKGFEYLRNVEADSKS